MEDAEYDIAERPIIISYGFSLDEMVNLSEVFGPVREDLNKEEGPEIPFLFYQFESELEEEEYCIRIYGKTVERGNLKDIAVSEHEETLQTSFRIAVNNYRTMFDPEFLFHELKLDRLLTEKNYQALRLLFIYYSKIAQDKKKAFHYLKMLSRYCVPKTVFWLSDYYDNGYGCKPNKHLGKKTWQRITNILHKNDNY